MKYLITGIDFTLNGKSRTAVANEMIPLEEEKDMMFILKEMDRLWPGWSDLSITINPKQVN